MTLVSSLERGGPVEQALALGAGLAEAGADVHAICATPPIAARFSNRGAITSVIPLRHARDLSSARRIWRAAAGADVVHAQDRRAGLWTCLGPRPRPDGIRAYTIHGLPEPFLPEPARPPGARLKGLLAYRLLDAGASRRADAIIVPSRAVADELGRIGYPRALISVVPNGVEVPDAPIEPGELVGTISVLEPVKALDVFLRAAAELAEARPEVRFAVYGEGSERERLLALIRELGLDARVQMPGYVPATEALEQLGVYVLCSYMENSPMALLEAMAVGVPAVATRVGGIPEIAAEEEVELVEAGDPGALAAAIARLLDDTPRAMARARAARARVASELSAEANVERTLDVYRQALEERRR